MAVSALGRFCQWLEQTPLSLFAQSHGWVVPSIQTIHILAISAVAGSALMINLRLMEWLSPRSQCGVCPDVSRPSSGTRCQSCS